MKAAAIQMISSPKLEDNLGDAARLIAEAAGAGARLVVLPENFACMPANEADRYAIAEPDGSGAIQAFLAEQARKNEVWLVGGTVPITGRDPAKFRSACLLLNDRGERVARYDKLHLFDVRLANGEHYAESRWFEPGERTVVVDTPFGRLGLAICYDLRFPELFRRLLDQGAELFAIPSAFTATTGRAHWELLVRTRAVENLTHVIAAGQGGSHVNGRETHGDSMIVDPWGEVIDRVPRGTGFAIGEIDRQVLARVRESLPSIRHRRSYD